MAILLLADHDNAALAKSTLSALAAAQAIGGDIDVLVLGSGSAAVAQQASQAAGVRKVLHADGAVFARPLAENIAPVIAALVKQNGYGYVLSAASSTGKDSMPRAAALLDAAQISEITEVVSPDTFKRPIYAGNAIETVQAKDAVKVITVRQSAFNAAAATGGSALVEAIAAPQASTQSAFVSIAESKSERPDLGAARVIISGGRGLGSAENFTLLEKLAGKLNAAIGASRAAVDSGYCPNDYQVGQTGKIVAPELYIAIGISGAIQHLAGMKDSKVIVAINKDENAPIFEIADYGLVGDLFAILPELEAAL